MVQSRENLMRNKTFYEVVVETGYKRSENASIKSKVDRYRQSDAEFFKHIKKKLPKLKHSKIFPNTAIEMDSVDSEEQQIDSPTIFSRSFDKSFRESKHNDEKFIKTPMQNLNMTCVQKFGYNFGKN